MIYESDELILCGGFDRVSVVEPLSGRVLCELTEFSEPFAPVAKSPFYSAEEENGRFTVFYYAGGDYHTASDRYIKTYVLNDDGILQLKLIYRGNLGEGAKTGTEAASDDPGGPGTDLR